jgi:aminoglycoside phosphotransferase (APT) family kinase protein
MQWPEAEYGLSELDLRQMLNDQFPQYDHATLVPLNEGFDNVLWRLGDDLIIRLARRAISVPLLEQEILWLPRLGPQLPIDVPIPVHVGAPCELFPLPWVIVPWFEGVAGDEIEQPSSVAVAHQLGAFLRALHQPAPPDAPENPWRGVRLGERGTTFEERMRFVLDQDKLVDESTLRRVWASALDARPLVGPRAWIHGDLHPANLIFADGGLRAVVDFGDFCAGDPATDLAGAWMLLAPEALDPFLHGYGNDEPNLVRRALGWATLFGLMFVQLGAEGRIGYERIGRRALENVALFSAKLDA